MSNLNAINSLPPIGIAPEMGRVKVAQTTFGVSRAWIYRAALDHPNLLKKLGRSTLVDFRVLRGILATLPTAKLRCSSPEQAA